MTSKKYSASTKRRAVSLALRTNASQAAKQYGISPGTIRNWMAGSRQTQEQIKRRFLHGKEVVDSFADLRIFVEREDIELAVPSDPSECAFVQACRRAYKSKCALFLQTIAYIELPDESGGKRVERFTIPVRVRRQIDLFDKTGIADPGGYVVYAPSPSKTLDGMIISQERQREQHRKALLHGEATSKQPPTVTQNHKTQQWGVRQGIGMAQFREPHTDQEQ